MLKTPFHYLTKSQPSDNQTSDIQLKGMIHHYEEMFLMTFLSSMKENSWLSYSVRWVSRQVQVPYLQSVDCSSPDCPRLLTRWRTDIRPVQVRRQKCCPGYVETAVTEDGTVTCRINSPEAGSHQSSTPPSQEVTCRPNSGQSSPPPSEASKPFTYILLGLCWLCAVLLVAVVAFLYLYQVWTIFVC